MMVSSLAGLTIRVDYRFDESGFFDNPAARAALEAAADRWSRVISQSLLPVSLQDGNEDRRLQLVHPATGGVIQLSAAASAESDYINNFGGGPADVYLGGIELPEDVWILFVGARDLPGGQVGQAGTIAPGVNLTNFGNDRNSFLVRGAGFIDLPLDLDGNFPNSLMVFGGYLSFDSRTSFHFDLESVPQSLKTDFYSTALHEMAHCFGLCSRQTSEWRNLLNGDLYTGAGAQAAYEGDTGLNGQLKVVGSSGGSFDGHFLDATFQSKVFPFGRPNQVGTVAAGGLQDLLMEGITTVGAQVSRYEISNVDLAALSDMGWDVIDAELPEPLEIPAILSRTDSGEVRVAFESIPGESYFIQTSLTGRSWVKVQPMLGSEGSVTDWIDGEAGFFDAHGPALERPRKFYRVVKP